MEFQQRLYELRRKAGLSQEGLADLVGVSRQAVQKWEAGTSKPDLDNLAALAGYFQVSLDYLITGKESECVPPPPSASEFVPPPSSTTVIHHYYRPCFEYKSKRTLFGLPLVHINCGYGLRWARGILAVGNVATGLVALGGVAAGLLSLGGVALGLLLALGGVALGAIAIGAVAAGLLAWGGVALGWLSVGGVVKGVYAMGGVAAGSKVAMGGLASAPLAIGAAAEGARTFLVTEHGLDPSQLEAAVAALREACAGAPGWVADFLCFFLQHI